jgi:hypothetical protein
MAIDDPVLNCLLEVCCEPAAAREALAVQLVSDHICDDLAHARRVATWVRTHFDLAPAGSLGALKAGIARVAKSGRP